MSERTAVLRDGHIEISFPFEWSLVDVVKDIAGRKWDGSKKVWLVPFTPWHCDKVSEKLMPLNFSIDQSILKTADRKAPPPKAKYPKELYPYQRLAVDFLYQAGGRCIVADDMGLGKTIEAIVFVKLFAGRTLVVCPASALWKWEMEFRKWAPGCMVDVIENGKQEIGNAEYVVMSYAIMVSHYEDLKGVGFDAVIFDEAHYLKSYKAQRTRVARALVKGGISKVLMLSGTPFENRPAELFSLLNMIDPVGFDNFFSYAQRYCGAEYLDGHWFLDDHKVSNREELLGRLSRLLIRRTKKEVAIDLPELTRTSIPVSIPNMADYKKASGQVSAWFNQHGKTVINQNALTQLNSLRQVVGLGKVDAAIELAETVLQNGKKVVLFAHHKAVVSKLAAGLKKYGVAQIVGDVPAKERRNIWMDFLKDSQETLDKTAKRVIIISTAGAEAIDLYSASDIIFVEREWTPSKEEQAESRLHRNGQKNPVNAWYIVAKGTVDEKLDATVRAKRQTIGSVITQDEVIESVLTML